MSVIQIGITAVTRQLCEKPFDAGKQCHLELMIGNPAFHFKITIVQIKTMWLCDKNWWPEECKFKF